jgi:glycosyltransferase involved in cell wall biosynthesis
VTSLLVVSAEPAGAVMAGPAIRAVELARALAARFPVTLAAPGPEPGPSGVQRIQAGLADHDALLEAAAAHDVVVAQQLPPGLLRRVAGTGSRLVADLYNPTVVEVAEATRRKPPGSRRRLRRIVHHAALAHLAAADLTLCASERQARLWRSLAPEAEVAVVPFGLPSQPPQPAPAPVLRGPVVPVDARVALWNGGIWDWLDAPTAIRALDHLPDDVHLVFLGTTRPALAERDRHRAGDEALEEAESRPRAHFLDGWVPYADRGAALLEADLVVSAHPDTAEARYAFRTRLLDALWAARPVVCTRGDVLAELIDRARLGEAVPPSDPEAFAAAISRVLAHPPEPSAIAAAAAAFRWERVAAPLVDWVASGARRPQTRRRSRAVTRNVRAQYAPLALETVATDGMAAALARLGRNVTRAVRHHDARPSS